MIEPNCLINGDCLDVMLDIHKESINLILCDLPYGTTDCKWDSLIDFKDLWHEYERILTKNGTIILTSSQPFTTKCINSNEKLFKYEWIWSKSHSTFFQHAKNRPLKIHEDVLIFSKGSMMHESLNANGNRMTYNPQDIKKLPNQKSYNGKSKFGGVVGKRPSHKDVVIQEFENYPETVIYFDMDSNTWHPTQKPIALFMYLIRTYSNEGEIVLDNCAGSMTTSIACINTKRKYICIEKDESYFERAKNRVFENCSPLMGIEYPNVIYQEKKILIDLDEF